jgi:hypothetical protein
MAARREEMFEFMGGSGRVNVRGVYTANAVEKTEGQALDNIAPGPIMHDDQLL